jgi:hypothetical protein
VAVRAKKHQLSCLRTEHLLRGNPENRGIVMRTVFTASRILPRAQYAEVLHHRVVPGDQLLDELASFIRGDLVAQTTIDIHVTPTP